MPKEGRPGGGKNHKSTGGGKNSNRPPPSREETVSRAMSYVLRHGAEKEGLKVDEGGWVNVQDLLTWPRLRSLRVTFPELESIVLTNAKKRFALIPSPSSSPNNPTKKPSDYLIRAVQGHSLNIASENLLTRLLPEGGDCPEEAVHGTTEASWRAILKSGGVKRMGRGHVHFAVGVPGRNAEGVVETKKPKKTDGGGGDDDGNTISLDTLDLNDTPASPTSQKKETTTKIDASSSAEPVISGMRTSADTLIWVDVRRSAEEGGLKWWRSENGVVLTEGDGNGCVELRWVSRVERRGTGEVVWRRGDDDGGNGGKK
ncbi:MAG: hypothetical protein Q9220_001980 [cf. Caloplaca sp. 1 TL-2023]